MTVITYRYIDVIITVYMNNYCYLCSIVHVVKDSQLLRIDTILYTFMVKDRTRVQIENLYWRLMILIWVWWYYLSYSLNILYIMSIEKIINEIFLTQKHNISTRNIVMPNVFLDIISQNLTRRTKQLYELKWTVQE